MKEKINAGNQWKLPRHTDRTCKSRVTIIKKVEMYKQ